MEILAPAGSWESLQAAVRCGADAVYLGASAFNARRNADNFDALSLADAVRYCHGRHVRVYVTLNTLILDNEVNKFISCLEEVLDAGPDSLIIQDLGVLRLIRTVCPDIPICASTQMAICNADGAHALEELGISQAVLARELSLKEIADIRQKTSIRLEAFVHGAHCMSVSGLCYFSSALGERSGNRGLCAQPCRMDFRCKGREYALSLKDLSLVNHIQELKEAGITSLKIEGRMKRPEYVAAAVTAVKQALRGETPDLEGLRKVFSRSGFTDGYLMGKRNAKMFGIRSQDDIFASKEMLGQMASLYRRELSRIPVNFNFTANRESIRLCVSEGTHTVIKEEPYADFDTGIMTREIAERALQKTGNTPFYPETIQISINQDPRIPSSLINSVKKTALDDLLAEISQGNRLIRNPFVPEHFSRNIHKKARLRARFSSIKQIVSPEKFQMITLPIEEIIRHPDILEYRNDICAELPTVTWPGSEDKLRSDLTLLSGSGLKHVTAGTIGTLMLLRDFDFVIHGEPTLNITNSYAVKNYSRFGLSDSLLSNELTIKQSSEICSVFPTGIIAYGRLPLMFFRSCPARTDIGCEKCQGFSKITDRLHNSFPLICHQKQYSVMHNSIPLFLGDTEFESYDFLYLYFTTESVEEVGVVLKAFENREKLKTPYTRGHAFSAVR